VSAPDPAERTRLLAAASSEQLAALPRLLASADLATVQFAQQLALAAMRREPAARVYAATAQDRLRVLAGQPQKFGTQHHVVDGVRQLWPVDAWTTDSERAKWGLPSLVALRAAAEGSS
jgi:hypothetical protein